MEILQERTQIAKALNFGEYPVLSLDVANEKQVYRVGGKIVGFNNIPARVKCYSRNHDFEYFDNIELAWYRDEQKLMFMSGGATIKNGFGYYDVIEMVQNANTPIVEEGKEFVLVVYNSKTKQSLAPMIFKINNDRKDFCMTVFTSEHVDKKIFESILGEEIETKEKS